MLALAAHAESPGSNFGYPASAASVPGSFSCWLHGMQPLNNTAVRVCEDHSETASGSNGSDAVCSSCSLLTASSCARILSPIGTPLCMAEFLGCNREYHAPPAS
jgi:hypothetical protein